MKPSTDKRTWQALAAVFVVSFGILLWLGGEIYREAPPIPAKVVSESGEVLFTRDDIETGQQVWRSMGGHEVGSIWGHGSLVAPDWNADWVHREALFLLDTYAERDFSKDFNQLNNEQQAALKARLLPVIRTNTYDPLTDTLTLSQDRVEAVQWLISYYDKVFGDDPAFQPVREDYAMKEGTIATAEHRKLLSAFLFWTSWSTETNRPGDDITYTNNWPHEPLIGNKPASEILGWSMFSVIFLIFCIGVLGWHHARTVDEHELPVVPKADPLAGKEPTPSMKATKKYFWTVAALFGLQIILGGITAHYAVEGQAFYGFPLSDWLPYSLTRTWHTQLAVFWIATAWLGTGLYIGPLLSGHEPRFQRFGVNFLYVCLLVIVLGSMIGEWLGVQQVLDLNTNFWFGHQGYEYVDLGRFWQIFLLVGLFVWLGLVARALLPLLGKKADDIQIISILVMSAIAIALFYGSGLMMGQKTHLAIAEYWRWWVVHLWVEGFFEVFATSVIALMFVRLGLIRAKSASSAVLFATVVFLTGGILGTLHHLYFTGAPTSILAWGASFSALEIVPLSLIGFEAWENWRMRKAAPWVSKYHWVIMCFTATAFWNLVGAGVFGFLINPPISLYYVQGLNTTPLHGHTAFFGVYGMLGIGLMLFCLSGMSQGKVWDNRIMKWCFWSLNIGLAAMAFMSLLPVGVLQAIASYSDSFWYARSPEFLHSPLIEQLVWWRVPGDILFGIGGLLLAVFMFKAAVVRKDSTPSSIQQESGTTATR
ncbi:nitric-oxide reductase large subunit [Spongorhabdus nitratireducens]